MADARRVIVTGLEELTRGRGDHGDWTLYKVAATSPEGVTIGVDLRSFQRLPIGRVIDVEVERREHERYGTTYTLKRPKASPARLQEQLDEHEQLLGALAERVDRVEAAVATGAGDDGDDVPF